MGYCHKNSDVLVKVVRITSLLKMVAEEDAIVNLKSRVLGKHVSMKDQCQHEANSSWEAKLYQNHFNKYNNWNEHVVE